MKNRDFFFANEKQALRSIQHQYNVLVVGECGCVVSYYWGPIIFVCFCVLNGLIGVFLCIPCSAYHKRYRGRIGPMDVGRATPFQ